RIFAIPLLGAGIFGKFLDQRGKVFAFFGVGQHLFSRGFLGIFLFGAQVLASDRVFGGKKHVAGAHRFRLLDVFRIVVLIFFQSLIGNCDFVFELTVQYGLG